MVSQHRIFYQGDTSYIDFSGTNFVLRQVTPNFTGVNKTATLLNSSGNTAFPGTLSASRVNNAYYNDIAEFFPRGEETEPGDIIGLDMAGNEEKYIKASCTNTGVVVGVHSDTFGYILGGIDHGVDSDSIELNMKDYIPIGLAGRVPVKFIGVAKKGMLVVPSDIPGVGCSFDSDRVDTTQDIVGVLVESDDIDDDTTIRRLNMLIRAY